jgi:hypothetical protein
MNNLFSCLVVIYNSLIYGWKRIFFSCMVTNIFASLLILLNNGLFSHIISLFHIIKNCMWYCMRRAIRLAMYNTLYNYICVTRLGKFPWHVNRPHQHLISTCHINTQSAQSRSTRPRQPVRVLHPGTVGCWLQPNKSGYSSVPSGGNRLGNQWYHTIYGPTSPG